MKYYVKSSLSENIHETPEGFLLCIGVPIARTGEMIYGEGETPLETKDGKILITRDEKEVFDPKTMASFEGKAVTITHPNEFVNPDNWKVLAKGIMQNIRRGKGENESDLLADLLITDSVAINLIKNGLREVSCGYEAEYTQTGEGRGVQSGIIGNHLALVDQGRAGPSYAINDHKAKGIGMKLKEQIKAIFARAQDEAIKIADESAAPEEKKDEKKADKSKDEMGASYDELVKMVKDLGEKIGAMAGGKQKDASSEPSENEPAKVDADDADPMAAFEERLKAIEASVAKLLEMEAKEQSGDESDLITDEDGDEEESEDDDFEESTMTGDTASRVEILAPGLKANQKDAKVKALKTAYGTAEGKKVIDSLTGGKAPTYDSAEKIDTLFVAASELLKVSRSSDLSKTKQTRDSELPGISSKGMMTAEQMNEINAKHYAQK